ncbi:MAG: DUF454 family protein [Rikenellaceae bacterium]|nr:DUF454 family protein [Rikenellaceae bacterium]MCL2692425.1 DUF454 family protein [Rikenellaceae bacterium]
MVGLAFLGAVLPLLPTTPLLLLALWFFSRSSEKLRYWLLNNRMFGKYLDDYTKGRGIPMRVKVVALAMLWAAISYSALWVVNALWVSVLLFLIAIGVTIHILKLKTKRTKRIVVLVPTEGEAATFAEEFDVSFVDAWRWRDMTRKGAVSVVVGGVGMAETAAAVVLIVSGGRRRQRPDMIILAGIAGALPASGLTAGDCVVVTSQRVGDLGAMREGAFTPLYEREYIGGDVPRILPVAAGLTVNCAGSKANIAHVAQIENMEGAAFFAVCDAFGVPFMEVRAVSNLTTDCRSEWQIDRAVRALAAGVKKILDEING